MLLNTACGAAKSFLGYVVLLILYRIGHQDVILQYINYEIALTVVTLAAVGLQTWSYKELDERLLTAFECILAIAAIALSAAFCVTGMGATEAVIILATLDKMFDCEMQRLRQNNHFGLYNAFDLSNQFIVKVGFVAAAIGVPEALFSVIAVKALVSAAFVHHGGGVGALLRSLSVFHALRKERSQWVSYFAFDILNFGQGQADIVVLKTLVPPHILTAYFFVRKFQRLPFVLLNYILDPAYVVMRREAATDARQRLNRLWKHSTWAVVGYWALVTAALQVTKPGSVEVTFALAGFAALPALVTARYLDTIALLWAEQQARTMAKVGLAAANLGALALPVVWSFVGWPVAVSLGPCVGSLVASAVLLRPSVTELSVASSATLVILWWAVAHWANVAGVDVALLTVMAGMALQRLWVRPLVRVTDRCK